MKYYNSIEELENCIGKFVYLYRTDNGERDGKVIYAWAKKITEIVREKNFRDKKHQVKYHHIYGTDTIVFQDNQKYVQRVHTPHYKGRKEEHSNAQQFARELTILEKLLCRIYLKRQEAIEKGLIKIKPQDDN
jgi:hypothetical protein